MLFPALVTMCLWLGYRNMTDHWRCVYLILFPYWTHLLILGGFLWTSWDFLHNHVICKSGQFPICMPFIFCRPTLAARTSRTMLNKSSESEPPCLIPSLRGKHSVIHPKYDARSKHSFCLWPSIKQQPLWI